MVHQFADVIVLVDIAGELVTWNAETVDILDFFSVRSTLGKALVFIPNHSKACDHLLLWSSGSIA